MINSQFHHTIQNFIFGKKPSKPIFSRHDSRVGYRLLKNVGRNHFSCSSYSNFLFSNIHHHHTQCLLYFLEFRGHSIWGNDVAKFLQGTAQRTLELVSNSLIQRLLLAHNRQRSLIKYCTITLFKADIKVLTVFILRKKVFIKVTFFSNRKLFL